MLRFDWSTEDAGTLSVRLFSSDGIETVRIVQNELIANSGAWDVNLRGRNFTVRASRRRIVLDIRFHPPSAIHVRRLYMRCGQWLFELDESGCIKLTNVNGGGICFPINGAVVAGGKWTFQDGGLVAEGGACLNPSFPHHRFRELANRGQFRQLVDEITAPR